MTTTETTTEIKESTSDVVSKEPKKKSKLYFNADTQAAIVLFQNTFCPIKRNTIYINDIQPAFNKLVENLINIYKFTSIDTPEDLKNDCITFLFETLVKFNPEKGNAFSYFNIVGKNYLIIKVKSKIKHCKQCVSFDDLSLTPSEQKTLDEKCTATIDEEIEEINKNRIIIEKLKHIINSTKLNNNELVVLNSIIYLFENIQNIDILSKNSILLYLRELTNLTPKQLTVTMSALKQLWFIFKL